MQKYRCIIEPTAEILAHEYFGSPLSSYKAERDNISYLIAIIGPKPVLECIFNRNSTLFEETIRQYLSEEDYYEFIKAISVIPQKADPVKIRQYIDKMLEKKLENAENPDEIAKQTLLNARRSELGGYIFNQHSRKYFEPITLHYVSESMKVGKPEGEIAELRYTKEIAPAEIKDIIDNEKYNKCELQVFYEEKVDGQTKLNLLKMNLKEYKRANPTGYFEEVMETINKYDNPTLYIEISITNNEEILEEINSFGNNIKYSVQFAGRKTYVDFETKQIQSLDEVFPEQTDDYYGYNVPEETATYTPIKL